MDALHEFEDRLSGEELALIAGLDNPFRIQTFLDAIPYSADPFYRCPLRVLRDRRAHCFDGALFAAAMLRRLGYPPRVVEMVPNDRDDVHLLAVYQHRGHWGAVAKSNFVGLRFREPVYRTLRELLMSYFEQFFNALGEKTLRAYRRPLNLKAFDRLHWMVSDEPLETIARRLDETRAVPVITADMVADLSIADERSRQAGLLGADPDGLFKLPGISEPPPQ